MLKLENLDGMKVTRTASAVLIGPRFVKENQADNTKVDQSGNNENALGLICVSPKAGEVLAVDITGIKPCEAGATIAAGDEIVSDASGRGVPEERFQQTPTGYSVALFQRLRRENIFLFC